MSDSPEGVGNREVAYRLFAAEYDDADLSYSESDEERAPNYVVTPTGARVNRLFLVGVLTEVETVSDDYLRARVVDPTGPFVIYAGQYQPDALAFLEAADPPTFVAVTGKARTFEPDDGDQVYTSVRPESINQVDAETRDRWVVGTAERTLDRVATAAAAVETGLSGDRLEAALREHGVDESLAAGLPIALDHYGTTGTYLAAVRELALDAARVVADEVDEVEPFRTAPSAGDDDPIPRLVESPIDVDESVLEGGPEETDDRIAAEPTAAGGESREPAGSAAGSDRSADVADAGTGAESGADGVEEPQTTDSPDATDSPDSPGQSEATGGSAGSDDAATDAAGSETESIESEAESAETETTPEESEADAAGSESEREPDGSESGTAATAVDEPEPSSEDESSQADGDLEDFEPEFELDEDEREEIESEFGTEFQSGSEVEEPGEADIDSPEPDEDGEPAAEPDSSVDDEESDAAPAESDADDADVAAADAEEDDAEAAEGDAGADEAEEGSDDEGTDSADVEAADVDLEDAVVDAMTDLDEGDGADREAVQAAVVDRTGADPGDVDDAIQEALMGGRCYEPDDQTLKPI